MLLCVCISFLFYRSLFLSDRPYPHNGDLHPRPPNSAASERKNLCFLKVENYIAECQKWAYMTICEPVTGSRARTMLIENSWDSYVTLELEGSGVSPALSRAHRHHAEGKSVQLSNYMCGCLTTRQLRCCHPKLGTWKLADKDHRYLLFLTIERAVIPYSLVPWPTYELPWNFSGQFPCILTSMILGLRDFSGPKTACSHPGLGIPECQGFNILREALNLGGWRHTHRTKEVDPQDPEPWAHSYNLFKNPFFTGLLHSLLLVFPWDHLLDQLSALNVLFHFRELRSSPTSEFQRGFEMSVTSNWKPFLKAISVTE